MSSVTSTDTAIATEPIRAHDDPVQRALDREILGTRLRLSWGALFGGTAIVLGTFALLFVLSSAISLSTIDPRDPGFPKGAAIGIGVGSVIASIIALFVGGFVTARSAGVVDRTSGAVHGGVLWGFATLITVLAFGSLVNRAAGAAASATANVAGAAGSAAVSAVSGGDELAQALGIDAEAMLEPINTRLRRQGKPTVTVDQLKAATQDALQDAAAQGQLNRELLTSSIAEETALSRQDANDLARRIENAWIERRQQVVGAAQSFGSDVRRVMLQGARETGEAMWWVFFSMLLGLGAALAGSTVGVGRRRRKLATDHEVPVVPPSAPPRREAHVGAG